MVLADFHNVAAVDPQWAEKYTANQAKYVDEPAIKGFQRQQEVHDAGYLNKDFASTSYNDAHEAARGGEGRSLPAVQPRRSPALAKSNPSWSPNLGFFPMPGDRRRQQRS